MTDGREIADLFKRDMEHLNYPADSHSNYEIWWCGFVGGEGFAQAALAAKDAENHGLRFKIDTLQTKIQNQAAEIERLEQFKSAIVDHMAITHVSVGNNPREHLDAVINWYIQVECDPQVSDSYAAKQIEQLQATMKDRIEQAHMAGQHDAGVDPSYSNAQAYYLETINHPEAE